MGTYAQRPSDPSAGTCSIRLWHDSTKPNDCLKYSSAATRLQYAPASSADDPRLQFQLFQVETMSRVGELRAPDPRR